MKSKVKIHVYMILKTFGISIWNFLLTTNVKYTATYILCPKSFKGKNAGPHDYNELP